MNGTDYPVEIDPHLSLLKAVRDEIGLTGSKEGCDDSECGACMMLLDGQPVNSCSYLAMQAVGKHVTTVEGLAGDDGGRPAPGGVPATGRSAVRVLHAGHARVGDGRCCDANPDPSEEEIRIALAGNLCRCTGYDGIVRAVQAASSTTPELPHERSDYHAAHRTHRAG